MVYKNNFLQAQAYQLIETKQWVARGFIKPVNNNVEHNYRWDKQIFKTKQEADTYALKQMMISIDDGKF